MDADAKGIHGCFVEDIKLLVMILVPKGRKCLSLQQVFRVG